MASYNFGIYLSTLAIFVLVLAVPVHSAKHVEKLETFEEKVDKFVAALLDCRDLVSINLAVVEGSNALLTKGYGKVNIEKEHNVSDNTLYGIASVSKQFAATLLGKVIDDSGYPWKTPVRDILGDDFHFSEYELTEQATLRDLLAHQMGVPSHNRARMQDGMDREMLAQKIRFFNRTETFRDSYIYNNLMFGLISYVTEVVGGAPWEELMHQHIFEPLGMNGTTFTHEMDEEEATAKMAVPYMFDSDGSWRSTSFNLHREWGKIGGSGSIVSNAVDMSKYLKFQLSLGRDENGDEVVPSKIISDTHTRIKVIPHGNDDALYRRPHAPVSYIFDEYAMGWRRGYYRGYPMILHTGTSFGYGALLTIIPDANISVFTSISGTDSGYRARRALHMYVMDLITGTEPFLNTSTACTFPDTRKSRKLKPATDGGISMANLNNTMYEGQYGNFGYGNISVVTNETSGRLQLIYGFGVFDLYTTEEDHVFSGQGLDDIWSMTLSDIIFSDLDADTNVMTTVTATSFEPRDPPVFIRGLEMSDAPDTENPCENKEQDIIV